MVLCGRIVEISIKAKLVWEASRLIKDQEKEILCYMLISNRLSEIEGFVRDIKCMKLSAYKMTKRISTFEKSFHLLYNHQIVQGKAEF